MNEGEAMQDENENESEYDGVVGTGKFNSEEFLHCVEQFDSLKEFLRNEDVRLISHGTSLSELELDVLMERDFDIDGLVVELKVFSAIRSPVFYLLLDDRKGASQQVYHLIKKHVKTFQLSQSQIERMKRARCAHVAYTGGWRITLALIPDKKLVGQCFESVERSRKAFENYFKCLCDNFKLILHGLPVSELQRPTLRKNTLFDISRMNVLPQDQQFVLTQLDSAIRDTTLEYGAVPIIFASKFGMKDEEPLLLTDTFFLDQVLRTSVHTACSITCQSANTHLLWSRQGLYEVVGTRGTLFGCLGIREAANFQSNMDSRELDISPSLRNVAKYPDKLTFVQLYSDTPHLHTDLTFHNPISGSVATCGLLHHKTSQALVKRGHIYLKTMEENSRKLGGLIRSRLEIVTVLDCNMPNTINPVEFFNLSKLNLLLHNHPLIVPYYEMEPSHPFIQKLQEIALTLCGMLGKLWNENMNKGGYEATWECFQLELALENFFYGKTLNQANEIFSTNLGPGLRNERSLSLQRGFLGLTLPTASSVPDSPPPLSVWTKHAKQRERVLRLFGLTDHLNSCDTELGVRLVRIILMDLYDTGIVYMHTLRSSYPPPPGIIKGGVALEQLARLLSVVKRYKYPFTFGRALTLVGTANRNVEKIITQGLRETEINYFPAIKIRDEHKNEHITWNKRDYWEVIKPQVTLSTAAKAGELTLSVVRELVSRRLTHERNLELFKESSMPWMIPILRRLGEQNLSDPQLLIVCTFLSAIALLQQNVYIDYNKLAYLQLDLPISQEKMRQLEIQSNRLLNLNSSRTWRLSENIPTKFNLSDFNKKKPSAGNKSVNQATVDEPPNEELEEAEDENTEIDQGNVQDVELLNPRTVPVKASGKWTCEELALLDKSLQTGSTDRDNYREYVRLCCLEGVPSRPFSAFRLRAVRVRKDK